MTITNTHAVQGSYSALRYQLFKIFEGSKTKVYYDAADPARPTIGIGLNLADSGVRDRVFTALGITSLTHRVAIAAILADATIRAMPAGENPGERDYALREALGNYLSSNTNAANVQVFELTNAQIDTLFNDEANDRQSKILGIAANTYEMLAILSAQYAGLYGAGLKRSIQNGNRAEAWYELRYGWENTGSADDTAFAKRRFAESTLFNLYDSDGVSSLEARQAFETLQLHRNRIERYESLYSS